MDIIVLSEKDIAQTMDLFCRSFSEDHYYAELFPNLATKAKDMAEAFQDTLADCIRAGASLGVRDGEKLIGFIICFDYKHIEEHQPEMFRRIFPAKGTPDALQRDNILHTMVGKLPGKVMYCLSLAVDPACQRTGIASALWDCIMDKFPHACFAADVSNGVSLEIYKKRNFAVKELGKEYYLVSHDPAESTTTFAFEDTVKLVVADVSILQRHQIPYEVVKEKTAVGMARIERASGDPYFVKDAESLCFGVQVAVTVDAFLKYQRAINVAHYDEIICSDYVYYVQNTPYTHYPLANDTLKEMVQSRPTEWGIVPDLFVSIPVEYDREKLKTLGNAPADERTGLLLRDMDFRTHYEAGIPASSVAVDDLAGYKKRIKRYYLGKIQIQITCENTVNQYDVAGKPIGEPISVDMFLSVDEKGNCGVLTWYSLSAPFLISQLLDNVIRNQVAVIEDKKRSNLFVYLNAAYGIIRRGTPKSFIVIPKDKSYLTNSQIASLLASETIYPDGEVYGEVIDPEITAAAQSEYGMGQYSRAYVAAYTNVVLQFSTEVLQTLRDRVYEESITLFYIELILFEEAAINTVDHEIIKLLTTTDVGSPVDFLQRVDEIREEYSKTIDFWSIQVNYPTSQKSIDMLRKAFKIDDKLERMKRNQEQLQVVFDTKFDIIDRKDAKRMDTSLAVLSFLAIFSAWIDSYDYASAWTDLLSPNTVYIVQKTLFVLILITAIYAVSHLFGGKLDAIIKARRSRKKNKTKHSGK